MLPYEELAKRANETIMYVRNIIENNALERTEELLEYPSSFCAFFTLLDQVNEMTKSLITLKEEMEG